MAIEEQAKKTDLVTLTKVFNDCIDNIYTSLGLYKGMITSISFPTIFSPQALPICSGTPPCQR